MLDVVALGLQVLAVDLGDGGRLAEVLAPDRDGGALATVAPVVGPRRLSSSSPQAAASIANAAIRAASASRVTRLSHRVSPRSCVLNLPQVVVRPPAVPDRSTAPSARAVTAARRRHQDRTAEHQRVVVLPEPVPKVPAEAVAAEEGPDRLGGHDLHRRHPDARSGSRPGEGHLHRTSTSRSSKPIARAASTTTGSTWRDGGEGGEEDRRHGEQGEGDEDRPRLEAVAPS